VDGLLVCWHLAQWGFVLCRQSMFVGVVLGLSRIGCGGVPLCCHPVFVVQSVSSQCCWVMESIRGQSIVRNFWNILIEYCRFWPDTISKLAWSYFKKFLDKYHRIPTIRQLGKIKYLILQLGHVWAWVTIDCKLRTGKFNFLHSNVLIRTLKHYQQQPTWKQ